jgi:hypothetical protein
MEKGTRRSGEMITMSEGNGALLPDHFPHIFFEIAFELLPEIDYDNIVYLSTVAKARNRESIYSALVDALRKIQWAKLSALDAITVDHVLAREYEDDTAFHDPIGQIRHAKSLLEFIAQGKAALDSLAVFLDALLVLNFKGGQRDFRHSSFRSRLISSDAVIASFVQKESQWLEINSSNSASLLAARDEWLHRGSPDVALMWPPTEVGALPISRKLDSGASTIVATKASHYSTQEFVELHFSRLVILFNTVVERCIDIEAKAMSPPPPRLSPGQGRVSAVKVCATKQMTVKTFKIGPFTAPRSSESSGNH